jgi:copper ion binding protein
MFTLSDQLIASDPAVKTVVFSCKEISCTGCKKHITEAIKLLDGIKSVDVNIEKKTVKVKFDESVTTIEKIKEAIEEAGYTAEIIS